MIARSISGWFVWADLPPLQAPSPTASRQGMVLVVARRKRAFHSDALVQPSRAGTPYPALGSTPAIQKNIGLAMPFLGVKPPVSPAFPAYSI
jgi:hypothetical protein